MEARFLFWVAGMLLIYRQIARPAINSSASGKDELLHFK
jgi:hypothetical protein